MNEFSNFRICFCFQVDKLAQLYNIHVRTGCFCNIGACQKYLSLSDEQIKHNFDVSFKIWGLKYDIGYGLEKKCFVYNAARRLLVWY